YGLSRRGGRGTPRRADRYSERLVGPPALQPDDPASQDHRPAVWGPRTSGARERRSSRRPLTDSRPGPPDRRQRLPTEEAWDPPPWSRALPNVSVSCA